MYPENTKLGRPPSSHRMEAESFPASTSVPISLAATTSQTGYWESLSAIQAVLGTLIGLVYRSDAQNTTPRPSTGHYKFLMCF